PSSPTFNTLSLHDALPIWLYGKDNSDVSRGPHDSAAGPPHIARSRKGPERCRRGGQWTPGGANGQTLATRRGRHGHWDALAQRADRKSTRLNSSHVKISYA